MYHDYEKREDAHGVLFNVDNKLRWTPVCGRRKKRVRLSEAQLRRFPPHCRHPPPPSDSEGARVKYSVVDGTPGLSVATSKTRTWTPIASRTRAKSRNSRNS